MTLIKYKITKYTLKNTYHFRSVSTGVEMSTNLRKLATPVIEFWASNKSFNCYLYASIYLVDPRQIAVISLYLRTTYEKFTNMDCIVK